MPGKLLIIDGPARGGELLLETGDEWVIGRDPDQCQLVVEDPAISRVHLRIRRSADGMSVENASTTNPALLNGKPLTQPAFLNEGDLLQIGHTVLRFTMSTVQTFQTVWEGPPTEVSEPTPMVSLVAPTRFMLKVVSGPNSGAEFPLEKGRSYLLGTDGEACDIVFFDLSVSGQHCRLTVTDEETLQLEDLQSRNGTLIDGVRAEGPTPFEPNVIIQLGTTTFFVMDRERARETMVAPTTTSVAEEIPAEEAPPLVEESPEPVAPRAPLPIIPVLGGVVAILLFTGAVLVSINAFRELSIVTPVAPVPHEAHPETKVASALAKFPDVKYLYNPHTGRLFLLGHVLTPADASELSYALETLPEVTSVENYVVVDEYIWREMNQVLAEAGRWPGVSLHAPSPGLFVVTGYLKTEDEAANLLSFLTLHFDYMDRLQDRVVVEADLTSQVAALLLNNNFTTVTLSLVDGELTLSGVISPDQANSFNTLVQQLRTLPGVRLVNNYVVQVASSSSAAIDISAQYPITGTVMQDNHLIAVVIGGRIVSTGDVIGGMTVTDIEKNTIWLSQGGAKFKIYYNTQ